MVLIGLSMFGDVRTIKLPDDVEEVALDEEGKRKLEALNKALSESNSTNKSTYFSCVRYFFYGVG